MLVNFQDAIAKRVLTLRGTHWIIIQPLAPNPIRLATNRIEAEYVQNQTYGSDGLQVNPSVNNADILQLRWTGELWLIAVNANAQCIVLVPGLTAEAESIIANQVTRSTVR